ncbi:Penicillin-binding protein 4 [Microbacterium sp. 8M]|uniref:serine hydrolase domain-containing protein n=1 Tax=Microbacterium sp. 8M TaxID=2653153 RepID=UPI0012EF471E|nr:serine hydrolase domain-containing protein [Microbacterium sp. 8M]VXB23706.1 Penicillin-binding protein 4 [Microbacterium sp. 8M]
MPDLDAFQTALQERLPALRRAHGVPAASIAVGIGDRGAVAADGVLNLATGVTATTDAVFQIGSITKAFTATLVMQLVDDGLLDLDAPIVDVLPGLRLSGAPADRGITARRLLAHTAGFEGDVFDDTGAGDEALRDYAALLADRTPALFPPGALWSYNNAGYCLLGRIVEVLRAQTWERALRERILDPLRLDHAAVDAAEAVLRRTAVGHLAPEPGAALAPVPVWSMGRSNAPAGSMLAMRAADLLTFARLHRDAGAAADGARVLSPASAEAMRRSRVRLPDIAQGVGWGLGWELFDHGGCALFGHDGSTIGQSALLRVEPGRGIFVAVLANGGGGRALAAEILGDVLAEFAEAPRPAPPEPSGEPLGETHRYEGRYASATSVTEVRRGRDGALLLERTPVGIAAEVGDAPYRTGLVRWRGDSFLPTEAEDGVRQPVAFLGDDGAGRALFLHAGRADRRVAS